MIRSVMVALEGTPASEVAFRYAVHMARWHDARVVMIAPVPGEDSLRSEGEAADLESDEQEQLEEEDPTPAGPLRVTDQPLVDAAAAICGQQRVAWRADGCSGDAAAHLAHCAPRADIVTVSRRGAPGARRKLPAHVFAVLRASARSVLVTPETYQEPQIIVAAYDGSHPAARALALAAETSSRSELPLSVVSIGTDVTTAAHLGEAKRYLAAYSGQAEFAGRRGDPVAELTALTFERTGTLLVIGAYGRRSLARLLGGSRTERLLRGCHGSALVVR